LARLLLSGLIETISVKSAPAARDLDAPALPQGKNPETVMLHFVQPGPTGGRSTSAGSHGE
jgi:hypothetical protein